MADEFPQSKEEAEQHIRSIRKDKGLGDGPDQIGNNAADLEAALRILSHDLYRTVTHFLLELIQNADDNTYTDDNPTLCITHTPGQVRIDCNEVGFNKKNIEAICRICMSTKSGQSKSSGYVGEKGIGFKSVFKVAPQVWINSGHYSFRFDRDAHLGMIAPVWDEFPGHKKKGWTSMLLKLSDHCDSQAIVDELRSCDPRILLFLRRLRKLVLKVDLGFLNLNNFKTVLSRGKRPDTNPAMMILKQGKKEKTYFVWRHIINKMPKDDRRPGVSSSEVVLAFPLNKAKTEPLLENQKVYSFLPIRDYGFKFLVQADFLLPANREDVIPDSEWNRTLILSAAFAYVEAMILMSRDKTKLRYTMVRFVPDQILPSVFFEDFRKDILDRLAKTSVLETQAGDLQPPQGMTVVPLQYCDHKGKPFLLNPENYDQYLSSQYEEGDLHLIQALGADSLTLLTFTERLKTLLDADPEVFFKNRDKLWHARFCETVTALGQQELSQFRLIPLRSGEWVSGTELPIFFPKEDDADSFIPEGINLKVVDVEAVKDSNRRDLYAMLQVKDYSDADITAAIIAQHQSTGFQPGTLSPEVLASHAVFLFNVEWENKVAFSLWMAADHGHPRQAISMYATSSLPSSASKVLPRAQNHGYLHPCYFADGRENNEEWHEFLQNQLRVAVYPRIMDVTFTGPNINMLHPDFRLLMKGSLLTEDCLNILRDGWDYYKIYLDSNAPIPSGLKHRLTALRPALCDIVQALLIECNGFSDAVPIKQTFSPLPELITLGEGVAPLLRISDPESPGWERLLKSLGVGVDADVSFCLVCLRGSSRQDKVDLDRVRRLVRAIELKGVQDLTMLRNSFLTECLIYVPSKGEWVTTQNCIWKGESWLTQSVSVEKIYPENEILFRNYLEIKNAGVEHIIKEAELIRPGQKMAHIVRIFSAFSSRLLHSNFTTEQINKLKGVSMFPIVTKPETEPYEYLASINDTNSWLIADRAVFWTHFQNILPILALTVGSVLSVRHFLEALGLGSRMLSRVATSVTEVHGDVDMAEGLTERYRSRSDYFLRLIPKEHSVDEQVLQSFRSVEVHLATKVVQYWRAPLGLREVQSTLAQGVAFLECDYKRNLRIYMRKGYESETNPSELADQLRLFFNIPAENRDLLNVVLTSGKERIDELFEARGIDHLLNDVQEETEDDADVSEEVYDPQENLQHDAPENTSRLARLLRHTRFLPAGSRVAEDNTERKNTTMQEQGISQPAAIQAPRTPVTLATMRSTLRDLEFSQRDGSIVGSSSQAPTFVDLVKGIAQSDNEIGEMIVSDILEQVLDGDYAPQSMWAKNRPKHSQLAAFTFTDYKGRFTGLLSRLDCIPGRTQGHGNLVYHIDIKTTRRALKSTFKLSRTELERARYYSVINKNEADLLTSPWRHVAVLAYIYDVRGDAHITFLTDPWNLLNDGQLRLEPSFWCRASLQLRPHSDVPPETTEEDMTGFNVVQIKPVGGCRIDKSPEDDEKGKSVYTK